jgi:hypothetical protein
MSNLDPKFATQNGSEIRYKIIINILVLYWNVLIIIFAGDQHPKKIRAIAMFKKLTFTATGNEIYVAHSAKKVTH